MHDGKLQCASCQITSVNKYHYTRHVGKVHADFMDEVFIKDGLTIQEVTSPRKPKVGVFCDGCRETFASKEQKSLHTCYSLMDKSSKAIASVRLADSRKRSLDESANDAPVEDDEDEIFKAMDRLHNDQEGAVQEEEDAKSEEPLEKKAKPLIELQLGSLESSSSESEEETPVIRDRLCKGCDKRYPVTEFSQHIISPASKCAKYMFT